MATVIYGDTPMFDVYIPSNTTMTQLGAVVPFSGVLNDTTGGAYSTSTYVFKPKVAGWYLFNIYLNWESSPAVVTRCMCSIDSYLTAEGGLVGRRIFDVNTSSTNLTSASGSVLIYLNGQADYSYAIVYMASSGSAILNGGIAGAARCRWQGMLVKGA